MNLSVNVFLGMVDNLVLESLLLQSHVGHERIGVDRAASLDVSANIGLQKMFLAIADDSDANLTNVLITNDWKVWRIDFTRAFRLHKDLKDPNANLVHCDRQLFEKLKALDGNEVTERTKHYLTKDEVKAVMARRDNIVAQFQKMIAEKGENEVLY